MFVVLLCLVCFGPMEIWTEALLLVLYRVPPLHYGSVSLIFSTEAASSPSLTDNNWTEAEDGVLLEWVEGSDEMRWGMAHTHGPHAHKHKTHTVITHITRSAASTRTSVNAARTGCSQLKVEGSVAACLKSHAEGADTLIMKTELFCFLSLSLDGYSTIDQRDKDSKYKSIDGSSDLQEREPLKVRAEVSEARHVSTSV